jgi:hypothetical protein
MNANLCFSVLAGLSLMTLAIRVESQPAPLSYREVPYRAVDREVLNSPLRFEEGKIVPPAPYLIRERFVETGATWLQLHFSGFDLGKNSTLTIRSEKNGESQHFDHERLAASQGHTLIFAGDSVEVILNISDGRQCGLWKPYGNGRRATKLR